MWNYLARMALGSANTPYVNLAVSQLRTLRGADIPLGTPSALPTAPRQRKRAQV